MGEAEVRNIVSLEVSEVFVFVVVKVDAGPFDGCLNLLLATHIVPLFCETSLGVTLHICDKPLYPQELRLPTPQVECQLPLVEVALLAFLQKVGGYYLILDASRPRDNIRRHQFY
jgi:hypothetical protein